MRAPNVAHSVQSWASEDRVSEAAMEDRKREGYF
ncbi:hypothetical protein NS506_02864 [Nocardia seriolae]|uniref:Sulfate adenylyltransferase n=1 Tax=Nocardia seriolae TaxID=37332 RepID=A0ABC8ARN9_9NOCA|nr:hypothetical protein NS506_02864 [Nocardia seriolae]